MIDLDVIPPVQFLIGIDACPICGREVRATEDADVQSIGNGQLRLLSTCPAGHTIMLVGTREADGRVVIDPQRSGVFVE